MANFEVCQCEATKISGGTRLRSRAVIVGIVKQDAVRVPIQIVILPAANSLQQGHKGPQTHQQGAGDDGGHRSYEVPTHQTQGVQTEAYRHEQRAVQPVRGCRRAGLLYRTGGHVSRKRTDGARHAEPENSKQQQTRAGRRTCPLPSVCGMCLRAALIRRKIPIPESRRTWRRSPQSVPSLGSPLVK